MSITLLNKYKFNKIDLLGKGGFGFVYKGIDIDSNKKIAIKIDNKKKYNLRESNIYDKIQDFKYMAKKIDYFESKTKSFMIMPLYGQNSYTILRMNRELYFNEKDVLMLGIQILQQLNVLHKNGILHRDIKPENFVFDKEINKFKLIDFGLSTYYIKDKTHIKFNKKSSRCGTTRYMSINCHKKYSLSRRDDLISLSYSLIYLYKKNLIWKNLKIKNIKNIILLKKKFHEEINNYKLSSPIHFLYTYSTELKFKSKPDYNFLIKGFYNYLKLNSMNYDGKWSWGN